MKTQQVKLSNGILIDVNVFPHFIPNATVVGLGLGQTMYFGTSALMKMDEETVQAVFAHELGHLHLGHLSDQAEERQQWFGGIVNDIESMPRSLVDGLKFLVDNVPRWRSCLPDMRPETREIEADKYASDLGYQDALRSFLSNMRHRYGWLLGKKSRQELDNRIVKLAEWAW